MTDHRLNAPEMPFTFEPVDIKEGEEYMSPAQRQHFKKILTN